MTELNQSKLVDFEVMKQLCGKEVLFLCINLAELDSVVINTLHWRNDRGGARELCRTTYVNEPVAGQFSRCPGLPQGARAL